MGGCEEEEGRLGWALDFLLPLFPPVGGRSMGLHHDACPPAGFKSSQEEPQQETRRRTLSKTGVLAPQLPPYGMGWVAFSAWDQSM